MGVFEDLRRRKVFQWVAAYVAGGFAALEAIDQLVGHDILPEVTYPVGLVFYLFGIPGAAIVAWFHGEKGAQRPPKAEIWLQFILLAGALTVSGYLIQEAREEAAARASVAAAALGGLDPRSVAVLPFEDRSPDGGLGYVAEGFTQALIGQLDQVRILDVISEAGVEAYEETALSRDSVARILEAGTLVIGSVEPLGGDRVRIQARLVDGSSGADIARLPPVDVPREELLAARDSVAEQVARALRGRLGEEVQLRERRGETEVLEAWAAVQRASQLHDQAEHRYDTGELDAALALLTRADTLLRAAEQIDPSWAEPVVLQAHNAMRRARITYDKHAYDSVNELIDEGIRHANRTLSMVSSASDPRALEIRGTVQYYRYLWPELGVPQDEIGALLNRARTDLEEAVRRDPGLASAHSMLSHLYYQIKDNVKVVLSAQRAYEEDAFLRDANSVVYRLFWGHYDLGQFRDAQRWCQEGAERFPGQVEFVECQLWMMLSPVVEPDVELAWQLKARLDSLAPEQLQAYKSALGGMMVAGTLFRADMPDSARAVIERSRLSAAQDPEQEMMGIEAVVLAATGQEDEAIRLLQRYVAANPHHSFRQGTNLHWWWENLGDHPEFQSILETREH